MWWVARQTQPTAMSTLLSGGVWLYGEAKVLAIECPWPQDVEPLNHFSMPASFYEELLLRYFVSAVVDLTPSDFTFGEVCLSKRVSYFAVAMTNEHAEEGRRKLDLASLQGLITPGHVHYNKKVADALKGLKCDDDKVRAVGPRKVCTLMSGAWIRQVPDDFWKHLTFLGP